MIALFAHGMDQFDDAPALEFFEAGADIRARDAERLHNVFGVQRLL